MHPQTGNTTKKSPMRLLRDGKLRARKHVTVMPVPLDMDATDDELTCQTDELAYLRAERCREVDAEDLHEYDIRNAEAEVVALFKHEDVV
jgi:hypothetical protein